MERKRKSGRSKKRNYTRNAQNGNSARDCNKSMEKESNVDSATSSLNDVSWYSRYPELLAAAARVPFPYKPGMKMPVNVDKVTTNGSVADSVSEDFSHTIPGVCAMKFAYSVGYSEDVNSPASIAAKEMYGRIRSKFSGSLDADAPDIFMYTLALDQIHAYIAYLKRVYKLLNLYTPQNRDYPYLVLEALGYDEDTVYTLQSQKVEFWGVINTLVHMANKWNVPDDMDLFHRHRWMNENVYLDNPVSSAQSYIFIPTGFYQVQATTEATKLVYNTISAFSNVNEIFTFGKGLITALAEWDDSYTINGYIERAYEGTPFYNASLLIQDEVLQPVYSIEVLTQINNFTPVGVPQTMDITQDVNSYAIIHTPSITVANAASAYAFHDHVMNLPSANPTAADVTVASRLMAHLVQRGVTPVMSIHAGTEIPVSVEYSTTEYQTLGVLSYVQDLDVAEAQSISKIGNWITGVLVKSAFNFAPATFVRWHTSSHSTNYLVSTSENITSFSDAVLDEITRVCIYSEFNCFR